MAGQEYHYRLLESSRTCEFKVLYLNVCRSLNEVFAHSIKRSSNSLPKWVNIGRKLFLTSPDEEYVDTKEYYKNNLIFDNVFKNLNSNDASGKAYKVKFIEDICANSNKQILSLYFTDLNSSEKLPIPYKLLRSVYGSNGMASGNTFEEAIIQGLSEIFERYCLKQICLHGVVPPDIPRKYIKEHFPNIFSYIKQIERSGNYFVRVRDCSLGLGLPVVCTTLFNKENQTSLNILGAHPCASLALERTFTEALQGRALGQQWNPFLHQNGLDKYNVINLFKNSTGYYPDAFYSYSPSYDLDIKTLTQSFRSNNEILDFYKIICKKNNFRIFIRNTSYLGFTSIQILIPGISEICDYDEISYNIDLMVDRTPKMLENPKLYAKKDILEALEFLDFSRKLSLLELEISDCYRLTTDSEKNFNLYTLMINLYLYTDKIDRCIEFIKDILKENLPYKYLKILSCVLNAVEIIKRNKNQVLTQTKLNEILNNFFDNEIIESTFKIFDGNLPLNLKISKKGVENSEILHTMIINVKKHMKNRTISAVVKKK